MSPTLPLEALRTAFGKRLHEQQSVARYTSARIGGPADALVEVRSADQLAEAASTLHAMRLPFIIFGGGSNMLVSDAGVRELVLLNHARQVRFEDSSVWAESGAGLGVIARQAAAKGLGGLEWAAGIPGTLGGAVVGNAGAHGGDMAHNLEMAEILHLEDGRQNWSAKQLEFDYRTSRLKPEPQMAVVLAATLKLSPKPPEEIRAEMDTFLAYRRLTQPPGASMGSMFKNPSGDHAGRLIEAVGLKGKRIGNAQISPLHGNFFLNLGGATSQDVHELIMLAQKKVHDETGVRLELEIKLIGDWKETN